MDKKIKVALTGASGNMGERLFATLLPEEYIEEIRILNHDPKGTKEILKLHDEEYMNNSIFVELSILLQYIYL